MNELPLIALAIQIGLMAASFVFVGYMAYRRRETVSFLPYTPRWPIPWEAAGGLFLAGFLVMLSIAHLTAPKPLADDPVPSVADLTDGEFISLSLQNGSMLLLLAGITLLALRSSTRATAADYGVDSLRDHWREDVWIGTCAALFSFGPVYAVHMLATYLADSPSQHPTLLKLAESPNPGVVGVAFLMAVILAPVWEELVFRSLLQGWLEKVEDRLLGWRTLSDTPSPAANQSDNDSPSEQFPPAADQHDPNPYTSPLTGGFLSHRSNDAPPTEIPPAEISYAGLSHGWGPILISAFLFAFVHLAAGPDPAAILLLGVILGYVYQRTHRLVPCIVCHMVFNGVSLGLALVTTLLS